MIASMIRAMALGTRTLVPAATVDLFILLVAMMFEFRVAVTIAVLMAWIGSHWKFSFLTWIRRGDLGRDNLFHRFRWVHFQSGFGFE